jgi:hypothetical protein
VRRASLIAQLRSNAAPKSLATLHTQGVLSRPNSHDFGNGLDFNYTRGPKHQEPAGLFEHCFSAVEHINLALEPAAYRVDDSSTLKSHPEDRIVLTIALDIVLTILQPRIRKRLHTVHYTRVEVQQTFSGCCCSSQKSVVTTASHKQTDEGMAVSAVTHHTQRPYLGTGRPAASHSAHSARPQRLLARKVYLRENRSGTPQNPCCSRKPHKLRCRLEFQILH